MPWNVLIEWESPPFNLSYLRLQHRPQAVVRLLIESGASLGYSTLALYYSLIVDPETFVLLLKAEAVCDEECLRVIGKQWDSEYTLLSERCSVAADIEAGEHTEAAGAPCPKPRLESCREATRRQREYAASKSVVQFG